MDALPVHDVVRGVAEILGIDPLYIANEGKLVAMVELLTPTGPWR
jgi:hydrogenase expression/formation protein HypE